MNIQPPRCRRTVLLIAVIACGFLTHGTTAAVEVAPTDAVSFTNDVMAVLSKAGCNMGACHGNANGKGGFRLSLRGQDPEFDHRWLTRESRGRRIDRLVPAQSLALLKPSGQLPHQGGRRFTGESLEYRILQAWIAAGAPGPTTAEPQLESLDVTPAEAILVAPRDSLQVRVVARFSDGTQRDVTRLATFELSNMVADIDVEGRITRRGFGETTVVVRYLDRQVPVRVAFVPERPDFVWQAPPSANFIDELLFARLRKLRVLPSPPADDHVFVRRAYLDAIGALPTADEARAFVAETSADKRERLVDDLLARPEFADHWALKWADILRVEEKVLDARGVEAFHGWIRNRMVEGTPIDQFVRELLRAEGSTYENPPANYWRANRDPATRGETTARLFLGARLQCAKCHNHPFDRWTQDDYYSWAALFARIDYEIVKNERKDKLDKNEFVGEQIVKLAEAGMRDPRTGSYAPPKLLGDRPLGPGSYHDRLTPLAVWLTSPENETFAQVQVNFVWYHLMGRGLVEPIDDFRPTNPASHPEVLASLAEDFVAGGFDLRRLVRTVMTSRTYQLSSEPNDTNRDFDAHFARAIVTRLPAERLLDAQTQVIGRAAEFAGYPGGMRAAEIPGVMKVRRRDDKLADGDRFLQTFGKPDRLLACECERSNETTLGQAFVLIGGALNERLADASNRLARLCESIDEDRTLIDELYWIALSRPPTDEEQAAAQALLADVGQPLPPDQAAWAELLSGFVSTGRAADDRFARVQDLTWALLNSKEFIFRH